jgi:carboxypeptidase family protein
MGHLFGLASKVTNPWSLAAFGVAAIVYIVLKRRGRVPTLGWICILLLVLGPILSAAYVDVFRVRSKDTSVYRVRVTVVDIEQTPIEDAKVWSSVGGEPKKVSAGWEFDIPAAIKPADGKVTIFAVVSAAFLSAKTELTLGSDYNPAVIVRLQRESLASIRGIVTDDSGKGIGGASVRVVGYETDAATTQRDGQFVLSTHAADGQQVLLRVEKEGYIAVNQYHPAGNEPVTIILSAK